jgi:CubicO group peptidase (beta-lactamase class C family)
MQHHVDSGDLPGLIYLVETGRSSNIESIGLRDLNGAPMERDTIVRISSMTKPISVIITLMLAEEGYFDLHQRVDGVLPELTDMSVLRDLGSELDDTVPANRSITVEDLLTFRAGSGVVMAMPDTYPIQRAMDERNLGIGPPEPLMPPEPDEWIRRFAELPLIHQPGEGWMYVTCFEILGVYLSRVTGMKLPDLFRERLFEPLGMTDTSFSVPEEKTHRFATEYVHNGNTNELVVRDSATNGHWNQSPDFPSAGAGLVSTIDDYARFARFILNGGVHQGKALVSERSIREMTRDHLTAGQRRMGELILGPGKGWGYGLAVAVEDSDEPGEVGSYGWNGGLGTTWLNDPAQGLIAILLTQVQWTAASYPQSSLDLLRMAYQIADESWN